MNRFASLSLGPGLIGLFFIPLFLVNGVRAGDAVTPANNPDVLRIAAIEADPDYGEYLAGECVACHGANASSSGVPGIAGADKEHLINALLEYKQGVRKNSVMQLMAGNLGDEEIAALATHFANQ